MPDKRIFLIAIVWIRDNLSELLRVGWTRAALLRRGRFSYPCGNWGIAWLDVWGKDDVHTDIDKEPEQSGLTFEPLMDALFLRQHILQKFKRSGNKVHLLRGFLDQLKQVIV